jgi:dTDP-4-dehydrorhamnose 3,5-epimerase
MQRFTLIETPIQGLMVIERHPIRDSRGYLERLYCTGELEPVLGSRRIVQINRTLTTRSGSVRGMHLQYPPHAETKVVSCLQGEIFDVAVDLRQGSPTLLHWHAVRLSADNHRMLMIPEGFAHGFQTLCDDCELLYLHTAAYQPAAEGGIDALDPRLGIAWPLSVTDRSERDRGLPAVTNTFVGIPTGPGN